MDVIIVSDKGMVIRLHVLQISQTKRATQGVRLINLKGDQTVVTLAAVPHEDDLIEEITEERITDSKEVTPEVVSENPTEV